MRKLFIISIMLICMVARAKAENVLSFPTVNAAPNSTITVSLNLNNSDEITAYQMDIPLGTAFSYVANSCQIFRAVDHNMQAAVLHIQNQDVLRILVNSPTNALLTGNSGNILTLSLLLGSTLGTYDLEPSEVIMSNVHAQAVPITIIPGSVTIANTPNLHCSSSLNMNPSSVSVTARELFALNNNGAIALNISNITFSGDNAANCSTENVPETIPAGETAYISVCYNGAQTGSYSAVMTIASNNPGGDVNVAVSGSRYSNGIEIDVPILNYYTENVVWEINLNNGTDVPANGMGTVAFTYPNDYYTIATTDIVAGERLAGSVMSSPSGNNGYSVMFMGTISGNNGALLKVTMHPVRNARSTELGLNITTSQIGGITLENSTASSSFASYSDETAWTLPSGEYGEPGDFTECINALNNVVGGGNLSLNEDITVTQNLTIDADVNIDYGAAKEIHTITINHGVSLLNYADVNAKYILHIDNSTYPDGSRWDADWHDISSPVANHSINNFITGDYDFFRYNEPTAVWQYHAGSSGPFNTMEAGRGYLVAFDEERDLEFSGNMNHGDVNYGLTRTSAMGGLAGFNLVGNPYPSYLDWHAVYDATPDLSDTYYVWDEDHAQYATYKYSEPSVGTYGLTRYISPCQGFFVICNSTSGTSMSFSDDARLDGNQTSTPFRSDYPTLKINVTGSAFGEDEAVVMLDCPQTSGALKMKSMNENSPSLYVPYGDEDYAILTLSEDFTDDNLPLSFEAGMDDEFSIYFNITNYEGDFLELEDLLTDQKINLLEDNLYRFSGNPDDAAERFIIRMRDITSLEEINTSTPHIYFNDRDNTLNISKLSGKSTIRIFDVRGILMAEKRSSEARAKISTNNYHTGTYIVQILDETGLYNEKVIIK